MRITTIVAVLVVGLMETSAPYGSAQDLPRLRVDQTLRDELSPERPIGGQEDIPGMFAGSPSHVAEFDKLIAFLPEHAQSALCARLATRNGRYKGAFSYRVASLSAGVYSLELKSDHIQSLRSLRADEFAVALWLANSCAEPQQGGSVRVVAAWSAMAEKNEINLLISSRRLIARIYDAAAAKDKQVARCSSLPPPNTSFDQLCSYRMPGGGPRTLTLQLFQFENLQDQVEFTVNLP